MKTISVQFQAWHFIDIEVPENWKPTPENLNALRNKAYEELWEENPEASWDATTATLGADEFDLDS